MHLRKSQSSTTLHYPITSIGHSLKKSINIDFRKQSLNKKYPSEKNIDLRKSSKTVLVRNSNQPPQYKPSHKNRKSQGVDLGHETAQQTVFGSNQYLVVDNSEQVSKKGHSEEKYTPIKVCENRLNALYEQIDILQKEVSSLQKLLPSSNNHQARPHQQLLNQYNTLLADIQSQQQKIGQINAHIHQLQNRLSMSSEEQMSQQMRIQSLIAEQEYIQQIIEVYRNDYPIESQCWLEVISLQKNIATLQKNMEEKEQELKLEQEKLIEFKEVTNLELDEKIVKKKVGEVRIKLMQNLQEIDEWAERRMMHKVREVICGFLADKGMNQGSHVSDWGWHGVQGWICRNGLLPEWQQYLYRYRNSKKKGFPPQILYAYLQNFKKMQSIINNTKLQKNQIENKKYSKKMKEISLQIIQIQDLIAKLREQKENLHVKIENQHNSQTLATIQHLQEQQTYLNGQEDDQLDLKAIKQTLRNLKKQQTTRMQSILQLSERLTTINAMSLQANPISFMNQSQELLHKIAHSETQIKILEKKKNQFTDKKIQIQNKINKIIENWQQLDKKKAALKTLYKELNRINKERDCLRLGMFQQKNQEEMIKTKYKNRLLQSSQSSSGLKLGNTLKIKEINEKKSCLGLNASLNNRLFNKKNKQNFLEIFNSRETVINRNQRRGKKAAQDFMYEIEEELGKVITRKPSLINTKKQPQKTAVPKSKHSRSDRESLTAMLMSKLTKC